MLKTPKTLITSLNDGKNIKDVRVNQQEIYKSLEIIRKISLIKLKYIIQNIMRIMLINCRCSDV